MTRSQADEDRFKETVHRLSLIATLLPPSEDLAFVRGELQLADDFGCFTDPTLWKVRLDDRAALRALVDMAVPFARAAEKFAADAEAIAARRAGVQS